MAKDKKKDKQKKETKQKEDYFGPHRQESDDRVFGVAHILATKNNTFIHVTDYTGRETYCKVSGGMMVTNDREESSPYAAMMAAEKVAEILKVIGVNALHIKFRARGGTKGMSPGPGG